MPYYRHVSPDCCLQAKAAMEAAYWAAIEEKQQPAMWRQLDSMEQVGVLIIKNAAQSCTVDIYCNIIYTFWQHFQ